MVLSLVGGLLAFGAALAVSAPAAAVLPPASTPDVQVAGGPAASVLYGRNVPVSLTASLPAGEPKGYNLAYRFVLPAGTSYVGGSAGDEAGEPTVISNAPTSGKTTLIWPNTYDLVANASHTLAFEVRYNNTSSPTPRYDVGTTLPIDMGAYLSTDPRDLADFNALGEPQQGVDSYSGSAEKSTTTELSAIEIVKDEPHPEGEIPRGVHDHQTVYTLTVTNNKVNPTTDVTVDDYLPAGLEFLGCAGTDDHTTDAPTNDGSTQEYAGSGAIVVTHPTSAEDCVDPVLVETVDLDPDGSGPLPAGIYTHVRWTHLGAFPASGEKKIRYAAAIPIRENTLTWTTVGGTPATTGAQTANLDNNSGPETYDEQPLLNGAIAAGTYESPLTGGLAVDDEGTLLRTAEDIAIQKSNDNNGLEQGDLTKWTVNLQVSEYRYVDHVVVRDTVPNGLCPLGAGNLTTHNNPSDAECAPTSGKLPSQPYTSVDEQSDGTFAVVWDESTYPALAHLDPSATRQLTFWTRTRANYQANFADSTPVLSRDAVSNNISTEGVDWVRCAPADPNCADSGTKVDHDETDGELDFDVSQSGKAADGPAILKQVAATYPASGNCDDLVAADYGTTVPVYGPGDSVCWKLRLTFPAQLDTFSQDVFDILPSTLSYVPGSWHATTNNTVEIGGFDDTADGTDGRLSWEIGDGGTDVDSGGEVFEVTLKTTVGSPLGHHSGDVEGNLQKFSYQNTAGKAFTLRDLVDFKLKLPELSVTKKADDDLVEAGQAVHYTVGVPNAGTAPAEDARIWDVLPTGISCSDISAISNGGTCASGKITWTGIDVPAGTTKNLTYTLTVPVGVSPAVTYTNHVGVVEYGYTTNHGTTYQLIPANTTVKDPALPAPNMPRAEATEDISTPSTTVTKGRTTSVTESGNNAADQATVGEVVTYTVTTKIPKNTTVYDAKVTDPLGNRQTLVPGSLCVNGCTLDGVAFGGVTESPANTVVATLPTPYKPTTADGVLLMTFQATVLDVAANYRGEKLGNTATLRYMDQANQPRSKPGFVETTIVEPKIAVTKTHIGSSTVTADEVKSFTVTASNTSGTSVSTAHDLVVVDTLPTGTEPVTIDNGGVWNAAARTITWNATTTPALAAVARGGSVPLTYTVRVESEPVGGVTYTNNVVEKASSLSSTPGARTSTSTSSTADDYTATASDVLKVVLPSITKDVTPTSATIGDNLTWTVKVKVPPLVRYWDTTVVDTVPDGLAVDGYGAITCTAGCPETDPVVSTFSVTTSGATQQAAWFLGDLAPAAQERTYELVLNGHVLSTKRGGGKVTPGNYTNSATVKTNRTNTVPPAPTTVPTSFNDTVNPATATTAVKEPQLKIDKSADKGPYVEGNDTVTYTVKVTNTGTWPAYDVTVTDQPDSELTDVALATGAAQSTDGWTSGDPDLAWFVPGPIAAGGSVTFTYTAKVKPATALEGGDPITNTAAIPTYWGVPLADRNADGDNPWREYVGPQSTVTLTFAKPNLTIVKTPKNGAATAGEDATFTIKVKNTDTHATAHGVVVHDVLPAGLTYAAGTATAAPSSGFSETGASGSTIDWAISSLAPGATVTITVPVHVGSGVATGSTLTNTASTHADEVPEDKSDTGSLIVGTKTDLKVTKTASKTTVVAGEQITYTLTTTNVGPSDALASSLTDTLPAYLDLVSLDDPTRCAAAGQVITCDYGTLAPGASRTLTVTVRVDPDRTGTITNGADVTTTTHDTVPANNHSEVTTPVTVVADVSVTKTADGVEYAGGDTATYTIVAHNDGPSTAQAVTVTDPLPSNLTFVSVTPGAPTCTEDAGTVTCAFGALPPGAERTIVVTTKAKGGPPVPAADSHDHQIDVQKVEDAPSLQAGQTGTWDLTCTNGATMTDGSVEVVSVDQDAGTKADVVIGEARSTALGTYRFTVTNNTTGQAQLKLFGLCVAAQTTANAGHTHGITVGSLQTLATGPLTVGRHTFTIPVAAGTRGVAPGIQVTDGQARLVAAEPVSGGWKLTVEAVTPAEATLSLRALQTRTAMGGTPAHQHALDLQHVVRTVTVQPGETGQLRVGCDVGYKGIVGTYDLPAGVIMLGHEPQPINRDFRVLNTTGHAVGVMLDLECLGIRTGPELAEEFTLVNTATVASPTYDPDLSNNSDSVTVQVVAAAGTTGLVAPAPHSAPAAHQAQSASVRSSVAVGARGKRATVTIRCAPTAAVCKGTLRLTAKVKRPGHKAQRVVIGTRTYQVRSGARVKVGITVKHRYHQAIRKGRVHGYRFR